MTARDAAGVFVAGFEEELRALRPRDVPGGGSVAFGMGGVAYALWRAGELELAARWCRHAVRAGTGSAPVTSASRGLLGVHALAARIAHARGDARGVSASLDAFDALWRRARGPIELYQGAAGRLAAAAALVRDVPAAIERIAPLADAVCDALAVAPAGSLRLANATHGRAGVALGILAWDRRRPVTRWLTGRTMAHDWSHGAAGLAHAHHHAGNAEAARGFADHAAASPIGGSNVLTGAAGIAIVLRMVGHEAAERFALTALATFQVARSPFGVWGSLGGLYGLALDIVRGQDHGFPLVDD